VWTRVFVYGTLLAGESNHGLMRTARFVAAAVTPPAFRLHDLDGFPGLCGGGDAAVAGELWDVDPPTLAALDQLEDHPVYYQRTPIVLGDGTPAVTYLLPDVHVAGAPVIASGDWRAHRARQG
jgi:gamma-glutamylcyclotransferase (GGCT)/AIG2-like uncharacterized protein YtfP